MNNKTLAIIGFLIITVVGISAILYSQGYFEFFTPEPRISLDIVDKDTVERLEMVRVQQGSISQKEAQCVGTEVFVYFVMVNSGDIDGFVNAQLMHNGILLESAKFFVEEGEEVRKGLASSITDCSVSEDNLEISYTVERP